MEDMSLLEGTPKDGKSHENVPLKPNSVLFNDAGCIVLSLNFKLIDESQVLLRVLRKHNMYSVDLKNKAPKGDHLAKFNGKDDEGFFVGYSLNSKAFRVFNNKTRIVEENLYIRFYESTPNVVGSGTNWIFDIDGLTRTMNYEPIFVGTQSNGFASTKASDNADPKSSHDDGFKPSCDDEKKVDEDLSKENKCNDQEKEDKTDNATGTDKDNELLFDPNMPDLEDVSTFNFSSDDEDDVAVADMSSLDTTIHVNPIPTTRIHKDHTLDQVIGDLQSSIQTRNMSKNLEEHGAFLYGKIEKEVYACQPPGFEDPDLLDRVYKVEKALYGLHQAPRAWKELCNEFERLMHEKFQMSSMGELTFFLGLHVKQKKDGICISQDKYVTEILKKFRYQVNAKVSHPYAMKRIFSEEAQLHACVDGKKIIITKASIRRDLQLGDEEGVDCLPNSTIFEQLALMGDEKSNAWNEFSSTVASAIIFLAINQKFNFSKWIFDSMIRNFDNVSGRFFMYPRVRKGFSGRVTPLFPTMVIQSELGEEHVTNEAVLKELDDSLVRAATTASSLGAELDSAQTRFESVSKLSNDSLLTRGNTLQNDEDRMQLNELMELCTNLQTRVLDLEKTKTTQKSLDDEESLGEDASKQGRFKVIDADEDVTLVNDQDNAEMFDVNDLVNVAQDSSGTTTITTEELTLAQALEALKTSKPKVKGIVIKEQEEPEPIKPKKKDQIRLDEEAAKRLQAEFDKKERLARARAQKEQEANIALIET
nr:retrotransposon protein, putative, unclassified [Tanacetum cinerariifolium]